MSKKLRLYEKIREALNSLSIENESNTPDFLLAQLFIDVLDDVNKLVKMRDLWYEIKPAPGKANPDRLLQSVYQDLVVKGVVSEKTYADIEAYLNKGASDVKYRDSSGSQGSDVGKS